MNRDVESKSFSKKVLQDESGILTLDFIFAIVLIFGFTGILFAFALTFTAAEVAQYVTFASARAYHAANKNSDDQKIIGEQKFEELVRGNNAKLGFLFANGWFELGDIEIGDFNDEFNEDPGNDSDTFVGARATLIAHILQFNIPIFGGTTTEELGAEVSSYLMREPTEEECQSFVQQRFDKIQQLKSGFSNGLVQSNEYAVIMDGGC